MADNKNGIKGGLLWSFGEGITAQLVSTIVTIVLARLLDPEHYGIISIVTVVISFCNVFVTSGLGSALVQKKETSDEDYNTAFLISMLIAVFLYCALFLTAPIIAAFYEMEELKWVLRIMSLRLPLAAFNSIQQARVQREMRFKRFFIATLFGTFFSGIVGIVLALRKAGVWALVAQNLLNTTVNTVVLFFVEKWVPRFNFSIEKAKEIFSFGWKVLMTELVATAETDVRSLIVGKVFGSADLAYYDQGKKYPSVLVNNINSAINKVLLPAYSRSQDDINNLKMMLRKSISVGLFVLTPVLTGFAAISNTFVPVILTDKWLFCIPYIKIFCLIYLTRPFETSCRQALLAIGRSDTVLRIMILINVFALAVVFVAVFGFKSVFFVAVGSLISSLVSIGCFLFYSNRLIGYKLKEQLVDLIPTLLCGGVMSSIVYAIGLLEINTLFLLFLQIFTGAIIYIALAKAFNIAAFQYVLTTIQGVVRHR